MAVELVRVVFATPPELAHPSPRALRADLDALFLFGKRDGLMGAPPPVRASTAEGSLVDDLALDVMGIGDHAGFAYSLPMCPEVWVGGQEPLFVAEGASKVCFSDSDVFL